MARIRTVKPEFHTSEDVMNLAIGERLVFLAFFNQADREGFFPWQPKALKVRCAPDFEIDFQQFANKLITLNMATFFKLEGVVVCHIRNFTKHQRIPTRETKSHWLELITNDTPTISNFDAGEPVVQTQQLSMVDQGKKNVVALKTDKIPYNKIVDIYNEICGNVGLTSCRGIGDTRKRAIKSLVNRDAAFKDFAQFTALKAYFNYCSKSAFLRGETGDRTWKADIEFVCKEANYYKICDGKYHNGVKLS